MGLIRECIAVRRTSRRPFSLQPLYMRLPVRWATATGGAWQCSVPVADLLPLNAVSIPT